MRTFVRASFVTVLALAGACEASAQQQRVNVTQRMPMGARADSAVTRIFNAELAEVKRMAGDWREREQVLITALRATPDSDFPARRRLEDDLNEHVRLGFAMMSAIEARCRDGAGVPRTGYLGLNFESFARADSAGVIAVDSSITRSITPNSPADRAGLQAGDKLLTIGGIDPARVAEIGDMLVPGRSLTVRYLRDGAAKEVTLTVARRPESFGIACRQLQEVMLPMRIPGRLMLRRAPDGGLMGDGPLRPVPRDSEPQMAFIFEVRPGLKMSTGYFAGAEFRMLDTDWQERLGVREGVLVSQVAPGSPAASSGLKGGDVVTAVGRRSIKSPDQLVHELGATEGSEVSLSIMRGRDRRTVTLKLGPR